MSSRPKNCVVIAMFTYSISYSLDKKCANQSDNGRNANSERGSNWFGKKIKIYETKYLFGVQLGYRQGTGCMEEAVRIRVLEDDVG